MTDNGPLNVLFLCTHNSARSILAEVVMHRVGLGKFKGYSAGSQPSGKVHPYALDLLRQLNYDTSALLSKSLCFDRCSVRLRESLSLHPQIWKLSNQNQFQHCP